MRIVITGSVHRFLGWLNNASWANGTIQFSWCPVSPSIYTNTSMHWSMVNLWYYFLLDHSHLIHSGFFGYISIVHWCISLWFLWLWSNFILYFGNYIWTIKNNLIYLFHLYDFLMAPYASYNKWNMQKSRYTYWHFWHFVVIQMGAGLRLHFWVMPTTLMRLCGRSLPMYSNNAPKFDSMHTIIALIAICLGWAYRYNGMFWPNCAWIGLTGYSIWYCNYRSRTRLYYTW